MSPGLVYEVFLIDPPECLPLFLSGFLRNFPNRKATQGVSFLILMSSLGIIPLFNNLRSNFKVQWFILRYQTKRSCSSRPKRSSVDYSLAISSLVSSTYTTSLSTSSKLVGSWYGILVRNRSSSPASSLSSWPKIRIFCVSPHGAFLMCSSRVTKRCWIDPFWCFTMSPGDMCPI